MLIAKSLYYLLTLCIGLVAGYSIHIAITLWASADSILTIGKHHFSAQALATEINYNSYNRTPTPKLISRQLDNIIVDETLAQLAIDKQLDQGSYLVRSRRQQLKQAQLDHYKQQLKLQPITNQAVTDYYNKNIHLYNKPAKIRLNYIYIAKGDNPARANKQAKRLLRKVIRHNNLTKFIQQHSDQPPGLPKGYSPYFDKNYTRLPAAVVNNAWQLKKINSIYPKVITTNSGYYLIQLANKIAAEHIKLATVSQYIRDQLNNQALAQAVANYQQQLRQQASSHYDAKIITRLIKLIKQQRQLPQPALPQTNNHQPPALPQTNNHQPPAFPR